MTLLRCGWPSDLAIIPEVATFMHDLREELRQDMRLIHPEIGAEPAQRDQDRVHVALVHLAFCGQAKLLSRDDLVHWVLRNVSFWWGRKLRWISAVAYRMNYLLTGRCFGGAL